MAVVDVKVRSLTDTQLEFDFVVLTIGGIEKRHAFQFSPKGTADADVFVTKIADNLQAEFEAQVAGKIGLVIKQNPNWEDVKTDTDGDGVSNDESRYNWSSYGNLYEIV